MQKIKITQTVLVVIEQVLCLIVLTLWGILNGGTQNGGVSMATTLLRKSHLLLPTNYSPQCSRIRANPLFFCGLISKQWSIVKDDRLWVHHNGPPRGLLLMAQCRKVVPVRVCSDRNSVLLHNFWTVWRADANFTSLVFWLVKECFEVFWRMHEWMNECICCKTKHHRKQPCSITALDQKKISIYPN